jgi:hypothetical protein
MDSLLRCIRCDACGTRHHFCLSGSPIAAGQGYEYCCPVTGRTAHLQPDCDGEPIPHGPHGAVYLSRAAEGAAAPAAPSF